MRAQHLKTWIEIDEKAIQHNIQLFTDTIGKAKLMSVVKSNAYGHGILAFPKLADRAGVFGFCVDSVQEGKTLRASGIKKPILVLGYTLPTLFPLAVRYGLILTISTFENITALKKLKGEKPKVHYKIETGMHRQGFHLDEIKKVISETKKFTIPVQGLYTHFSSAKDINYPTYAEIQFKNFKTAVAEFKKAGFVDLIEHVSATGGTLLNKKYHLDWVRVGIGLYGLWTSKEIEVQLR